MSLQFDYMASFNGTAPVPTPGGTGPYLSWVNVGIGLLFIVFDAVLSGLLGLGIGRSLVISALRCIIQLSVMGLVLGRVFASHNIWAVAGIALLLNVLGAIEAVFNKAKKRFTNMVSRAAFHAHAQFPCILLSMMCGTIPISILGSEFAMAQHPFWQPDQYIPILGMLLGNAISAIGVAINTINKEFSDNRDKVETYLAMGASRFEAVKPIATEALTMALLPTINQMSIIGLISIPGMMTGAIVGGKSVEQAARLQMIIMFMISASSALCVLAAEYFALTTLVDGRQRVRSDRLDSRKPALYRAKDRLVASIEKGLRRVFCFGKRESGTEEERQGLLSGQHSAPSTRPHTPAPPHICN
ncbi:hypothetical protein Q8F55_005284 [Vanrija albida]|uniref:ABC transmembrane type-1 domain-containing protein n=1 Tax=Vanrija albida TaxID=181172 RepID=A0ABR3Q1X3_9TREE